MARGASSKLKPFQKLLTLMVSGNVVTVDEIDALLGKEIYMYRLSTYMWHIKTNANGIIRPTKDGRKVTGYQLCNVDEIKEYMKRVGITTSNYQPGQVEKKPSISKLADLNAKPKAKKVKAAPAPVAEVVEELEITEVTE
jgi:hypothetical protein